MNDKEKKEMVTQLAGTLVAGIVRAIDDSRVPAAWDGHELRMLLAREFERETSCSLIRKNPRSARARAYRNHLRCTSI